MLKHGDAWSRESSKLTTPDSGLAPSLKDSCGKYGEPFPSEQARSETPSSVQSSGKGSNSTAGGDDNEESDVYDEKMTEAQTIT